MKRLNSSDSLGGLISMCAEEKKSNIYSRGFQSMLDGLDEDDIGEESGHFSTEKKRRLNIDQVKALEKNFEVENKLEPERKVKLAQELGLQPRQVAIWFQNRRARWKTKQLERDYGVLKASYDALKLKFEAAQHDKEALLSEVRELKSRMPEEDETTESNPIATVKEEAIPMESEHELVDDHIHNMTTSLSMVGGTISSENTDPNLQNCCNDSNSCLVAGISLFRDLKDGSSDSDSSAILNEDTNAANSSSSGVLQQQQNSFFQFSGSNREITSHQKPYQQQYQQFVRMEEHNFFGAEETCNFFTDDQAPTLQWCYPDQWE